MDSRVHRAEPERADWKLYQRLLSASNICSHSMLGFIVERLGRRKGSVRISLFGV
jgi:hypothetical protein